MSTVRKIDNPHEGFLYRVVEWDADEECWFHTNYNQHGKPRTYMTLAAARGVKTSMEHANARYRETNPRKFAVQRMPVEGWKLVPE